MKKSKLLTIFAAVVLFVGLSAQSVLATGGYFRHGIGIRYSSLAGGGTALSLSSLGAASNPAGLAFLGRTTYDVNVAYFNPMRQFTVTGNPSGFPGTFGLKPQTLESDRNTFFFPSIGASFALNKTMALGVMLFGNGGMNTEYPDQVFYDPTSPKTGVDIDQMFVGVTYSLKLAYGHAIGVTALLAYDRFAAQGLAAFSGFSSDPTALTGNKNSTATGVGVRVGYQGQLMPALSIGASYQMKISMGEFDDYKGLFAEQGGFDIPATWNVGIAVTPAKGFKITADFQQILYSGVKSIANPMDLTTNYPADPTGKPNPNFQALGTDGGWGFGWTDINIYKFGLMYEVNNWTIMAGYSYGDNPVQSSEVLFNILAPGVIQNHITFGITRKVNKSNALTVSMMYAPSSSVTGPNPLEAPGQQTIKLEMKQLQLEIGWQFSSL